MMISYNVVVSHTGNIITAIKQVYGYYDVIRVVNSNPREPDLGRQLQRFDIEYYEREWDNIGNQARFLLSKSKIGEWFHFAGDDCLPSIEFLEHISETVRYCDSNNMSMICMPYISEVDGIKECESKSRNIYAYKSNDLARKYGLGETHLHIPPKVFKVTEKTEFMNDVHEYIIGYGSGNVYISPYAIIHKKPFGGYLVSALWQSLHDSCDSDRWKAEPNGYNLRVELLQYTKDSDIEPNLDSIMYHIENGLISDTLKNWIMINRDSQSHYIYPWFLVYYLMYHPEELPIDFWDVRLLNLLVSSYIGSDKEVDILSMSFHPIIKELFIKHGIMKITVGCVI